MGPLNNFTGLPSASCNHKHLVVASLERRRMLKRGGKRASVIRYLGGAMGFERNCGAVDGAIRCNAVLWTVR